MSKLIDVSQVAAAEPFDNSVTNTLIAQNTQSAIDEVTIKYIPKPLVALEGNFLRFLSGVWTGSTIVGTGSIQYVGFVNTTSIVVVHGLGHIPIFQLTEITTASSGFVNKANENQANAFQPGVGVVTASSQFMQYTNIASIVHDSINQSTITLFVAKTGIVIIVG